MSETLDDLKDSAVVSETDTEDITTAPERPMTSMSNECLPDPSNLEIPDMRMGKGSLFLRLRKCYNAAF